MASSKPGIALIINAMRSDKSGQDPHKKQSKLKDLLAAKYDGESDSEDMSGDEKAEVAMQDFIDAVRKSDAKAALEAYKDLMKLCREDEGAEDDEEYINDDHQSGAIMDDA
jgi:hypothetical protein